MDDMAIRILLADDHVTYRSTVRELLEHEPDLEVIGEVGDGADAVRADREGCPDVVIMDIAMPAMDGIEATRRIREQRPDARVLALSLHSDPRFVEAMLKAGATGYVLKQDSFEDLLSAVHEVAAGRAYLSSGLGPSRSHP
jgi:DNA-binding NarL/FixJ family response regulator